MTKLNNNQISYQIKIPVGNLVLEGEMCIPSGASGLVIFVHGSASSRHSPRNKYLAQVLCRAGLATLLFDLLVPEEEKEDRATGRYRFNVRLLANRLIEATLWLKQFGETKTMAMGYFGTSTGTAASLIAAAEHPGNVRAIVSRSGRPDLAKTALPYIKVPTLLIVGGHDLPVIAMNREALHELECEKKLVIVPGASHQFEEPGTLEEVARLAANWFTTYLTGTRVSSSGFYSPGLKN